MPKYWLDGIFDDPIEEVIDIQQKMKDVIVQQFMTTVVSKTSSIIICKNFVYCEDISCTKRHWYNGDYYCRKSRRGRQWDEAQKLDRFICRYQGKVIVE